jgi:hypothetical protein
MGQGIDGLDSWTGQQLGPGIDGLDWTAGRKAAGSRYR